MVLQYSVNFLRLPTPVEQKRLVGDSSGSSAIICLEGEASRLGGREGREAVVVLGGGGI
jgi:hypothetical protein